MSAQREIQNLDPDQVNQLLGALAWRIDEYGYIGTRDFHRALSDAMEDRS